MRKNGEEFPADAAISKLEVGGKRIFTVILRDISAQKRLEEDLRRALQSRDDVMGIVAHDLRNPLGSILMQAGLLGHRLRDAERETRKPVDAIERAAIRMNRLIEDLLDVSRIEAGRLPLQFERLRARQLVFDAMESQMPLAKSASVDLQSRLAQDLPDVAVDRDRLQRVFENLIGNALKFTKPGGCITVGAAPRNGDVLFWVGDTGSGIDPDELPHLFDWFWQGRQAGRRGAGLGLPIVKGIVEAHRGRIWVESTVGRGSTFFFAIPAAPRAEAWQAEPATYGA